MEPAFDDADTDTMETDNLVCGTAGFVAQARDGSVADTELSRTANDARSFHMMSNDEQDLRGKRGRHRYAVWSLSVATLLIVGIAFHSRGISAPVRVVAQFAQQEFLVEQDPVFHVLANGSCALHGLGVVKEEARCYEAAMTMGLMLSVDHVMATAVGNRPEGCYIFNSQDGSTTLWFDNNPANVGKGFETSDVDAGNIRKPICESRSTSGLKPEATTATHPSTSVVTSTSAMTTAMATTTMATTTSANQSSGYGCGWPGDDCRQSSCCRLEAEKCFSKDSTWAACTEKCTPGIHETDPINPEVGKRTPWACTVLGGYRPPPKVLKAKEGSQAGTSLFCFSVVSPHLGPPGIGCPGGVPCPTRNPYEDALVQNQRSTKQGIFACDESDVLWANVVNEGPWRSFANTDIFLAIWDEVFKKGTYARHDWTVKLDPDAVFLPDRLKIHLKSLGAPKDTALFLKNINFKFGFMGALEILSTKAMDKYHEGKEQCAKFLGHEGGEDFYMMSCLTALGVSHMRDDSLLNDKYALGDAACRAAGTCTYDVRDTSPCNNQASVAFHPYKDVSVWNECHQRAVTATWSPPAPSPQTGSVSDAAVRAPSPPSSHSGSCSKVFTQCGGQFGAGPWSGPTCCEDGCTCVADRSGFYSQCTPPAGQWTCASGSPANMQL